MSLPDSLSAHSWNSWSVEGEWVSEHALVLRDPEQMLHSISFPNLLSMIALSLRGSDASGKGWSILSSKLMRRNGLLSQLQFISDEKFINAVCVFSYKAIKFNIPSKNYLLGPWDFPTWNALSLCAPSLWGMAHIFYVVSLDQSHLVWNLSFFKHLSSTYWYHHLPCHHEQLLSTIVIWMSPLPGSHSLRAEKYLGVSTNPLEVRVWPFTVYASRILPRWFIE